MTRGYGSSMVPLTVSVARGVSHGVNVSFHLCAGVPMRGAKEAKADLETS